MNLLEIDKFVEDTMFLGICRGHLLPKPEFYNEGYRAHADGLGFHECPYEQHLVSALSWRIGWNDRALKENQ